VVRCSSGRSSDKFGEVIRGMQRREVRAAGLGMKESQHWGKACCFTGMGGRTAIWTKMLFPEGSAQEGKGDLIATKER